MAVGIIVGAGRNPLYCRKIKGKPTKLWVVNGAWELDLENPTHPPLEVVLEEMSDDLDYNDACDLIVKAASRSQEWAEFLAGHWQKELPGKPGEYPVASRTGLLAGTRLMYQDGEVLKEATSCSRTSWEGWWWSEPLPDLPQPPLWKGDPS